MVRTCALDSGTLTADTEIVRMSHCGFFFLDNIYYKVKWEDEPNQERALDFLQFRVVFSPVRKMAATPHQTDFQHQNLWSLWCSLCLQWAFISAGHFATCNIYTITESLWTRCQYTRGSITAIWRYKPLNHSTESFPWLQPCFCIFTSDPKQPYSIVEF